MGDTDWGADKSTLLTLYRTLVRSKLDYGSAVYGSEKNFILKELDPIHHQGLLIALGAFRTSPVPNHRRLKLSMNYCLKMKFFLENPCYNQQPSTISTLWGGGGGVGGAGSQSVEHATPGEEVPGSIPAVAAGSLLVGSVSV